MKCRGMSRMGKNEIIWKFPCADMLRSARLNTKELYLLQRATQYLLRYIDILPLNTDASRKTFDKNNKWGWAQKHLHAYPLLLNLITNIRLTAPKGTVLESL